MSSIKETIRAEIERLKEEASIGLCEYDAGYENGICETCNSLLSFLDTLPEQPARDFCKENCKGYQDTGRCFVDGPCMVDPPASEEQTAILKLCATVRRYAAPAKDDDYCSRSELLRAVADAEKIAHGMK